MLAKLDTLNLAPDPSLSRRLLDRLKSLSTDVRRRPQDAGFHTRGAGLFSYCSFEFERLSTVVSETPRIGIVLSGAKEFWLADAGQRFVAGEVFCLPAGVAFDAVNIPSDRSGIYESLLVEVTEVPRTVLDMTAPRGVASGFDLKVPLTEELVDALAHAAIALGASDHAQTLAAHRLAEVLILLRTVPPAACLFEQSVAERVTWAILGEPSRRWTAQAIGRELGVGGSTLRRHLVKSGTSVRELLLSARMQFAHDLLARGNANVTEAAVASGYTSRSHFVRQFRSAYGIPPSELKQGGR